MNVTLLTGSRGFVGSHLRGVLEAAGWRVVGLGRSTAEPAEGEYIQADVTDEDALSAVIGRLRPDVVFHLAGAVGQKEPLAREIVRSVVDGTKSVCGAIVRARVATRLVLAGSSAQYGAAPSGEDVITEDSPCHPVTPYGHAKLAAEAVAFALSLDGSFEVVAARAFNHVGPGEPPTTVAGALASRIAAVLQGSAEHVEASELGVVRDFTDVRDIARAYVALAQRGVAGRTYNICSGRGTSVGEILDGLLDAARLDRSIVQIVPSAATALSRQVGSPARVQTDTGWSARIPLSESLRDLLASVVSRPGNTIAHTRQRPLGAA